MCWSVRSSLVAACYGYAVCAYLHGRKYSARDGWYALFLASFTTTQLFDAFFWSVREPGADDLPCSPISVPAIRALEAGAWNRLVSRFILPLVLFFQPVVLSLFPSDAHRSLRTPYRLLTGLATLVPIIYCGCTRVWTGTTPVALPTLLWGGVLPPYWLVVLGIALWSVGAALFCRPRGVWMSILGVGGFNLGLLEAIDGTIALISKLCFWCLLLSFLFLADPLWLPPSGTPRRAPAASRAVCSEGESEAAARADLVKPLTRAELSEKV